MIYFEYIHNITHSLNFFFCIRSRFVSCIFFFAFLALDFSHCITSHHAHTLTIRVPFRKFFGNVGVTLCITIRMRILYAGTLALVYFISLDFLLLCSAAVCRVYAVCSTLSRFFFPLLDSYNFFSLV